MTDSGSVSFLFLETLVSETKQDVLLVLKHMYKEGVDITSSEDAPVLAEFGHKHNISQLHKLSEKYLVEKMELTKASHFNWAEFAEQFELNRLLSHCERGIIINFHSMSATEKKLSSVSHKSFSRIMDGLAWKDAGALGSDLTARLYFCDKCCDLNHSSYCRCGILKRKRVEAMAPSAQCLLQWQKN